MSEEITTIEKKDEGCSPASVIPMMPQMIRPIVTVEKAVEAWKEYQTLKTKLADKGDFANIQGRQHPTKQFANKLSKFFGLSVQIIKAEKEVFEDSFTWHIWARATAPNGQFRESDGHCSSKERKFSHLEHDVYATAVTRAKNRTILELAGFGEVTAEEIVDDNGAPPQAKKPTIEITSPKDGKKYAVSMAGALKAFADMKKKLGDEVYYDCLATFQVEHANQIPFADMPKVFDIMIDLAKQAKK